MYDPNSNEARAARHLAYEARVLARATEEAASGGIGMHTDYRLWWIADKRSQYTTEANALAAKALMTQDYSARRTAIDQGWQTMVDRRPPVLVY